MVAFCANCSAGMMGRFACVAHMDENLKVVSLDIADIERPQGDLLADISPERDDQTETLE